MSIFDDLDRIVVETFGDCTAIRASGQTFDCIFDDEYTQTGNDQYLVQDHQTVISFVSDDAYGLQDNEVLLIDDKEYTVVARRPTRDGWAVAIIEAIE